METDERFPKGFHSFDLWQSCSEVYLNIEIMGNYLNCRRKSEGNEITIEVLNTDCLLEIFSYLSLEEALTVSKVCKHWHDCQQWHRCTTLDLMEINLSDELTTHLVSLCGRYLTKLSAKVTTKCNIVAKLNENSGNLESLSLCMIKCSNSSLSTLFLRNKKLKYVKLDKTSDTFDPKCLRNLPDGIEEIHLSTFSPYKNFILEKTDLEKFEKLRVITLRHFSLEEITLQTIMKKARHLVIAYCMTDHLDVIFQNLTGVEYLYIKSIRISACVQVNGHSIPVEEIRPRYLRIISEHKGIVDFCNLTDGYNKFTMKVSKFER